MRQRGYIIIAVLAAIIVIVALNGGNWESDNSGAYLDGTGYMEIKELEEKVLGKDWDALDIVDTAAHPEEALDKLTELVQNDDPEVREIALNCVSMIKDARVPKILAAALSDDDDDVRLYALQALQTAYDESILNDLAVNLDNNDGEIRGGVSLLLGELGRPEAVEPLERRLAVEQDEAVGRNVKLALARLGNPEMKEHFVKQMDVADSRTRYQGLEDLRYIRDKALAYRLMPALDDFGEADPVGPPGEPDVPFNRICDKAVNLIDELFDQPFPFETSESKIYSEDELNQVKSFLSSLEEK